MSDHVIMNGKEEPLLQDFIAEHEAKLKPCPFCGSEAILENTHTPHYWVECSECQCQISDPMTHENYGDLATHKASIVNATKAWNTRRKPKTTHKLLS